MKRLFALILSLIMAVTCLSTESIVLASGLPQVQYSATLTASKKLSKPKGVKAVAKSTSSIKVSWKKVKNAKGYYLYRSTSKNGKYKRVATIKKGSTLSRTDKNLKSGKTYYYKVRAYSKKKKSPYSAIVKAKTKSKSYKKYYEDDYVTLKGTVRMAPWEYKGGWGYVYYLELPTPIKTYVYSYPYENELRWYTQRCVYLYQTMGTEYCDLDDYVDSNITVSGWLFGLNKGYMVGWESTEHNVRCGISDYAIEQ